MDTVCGHHYLYTYCTCGGLSGKVGLGSLSVSISTKIMPRLKTSLGSPYSSESSTSGDMNSAVPAQKSCIASHRIASPARSPAPDPRRARAHSRSRHDRSANKNKKKEHECSCTPCSNRPCALCRHSIYDTNPARRWRFTDFDGYGILSYGKPRRKMARDYITAGHTCLIELFSSMAKL